MTEATNERPTRRLMKNRDGETLVVELSRGLVTIRPLGTRRGGPAEVELPIGVMYQRGMMAKAVAGKKVKISRGLLK
jgi:hypothetical protein